MQEILVILTATDSTGSMAALKQHYQVTATAPPRLAVVSTEEERVEDLRRLIGVEEVLAQSTDLVRTSLSEAERLFVEAWRTRQLPNAKNRRGDNLSWDAPGFLPPDKPKPK